MLKQDVYGQHDNPHNPRAENATENHSAYDKPHAFYKKIQAHLRLLCEFFLRHSKKCVCIFKNSNLRDTS